MAKKLVESIAAGKKVPCLVCGEPLIVSSRRSGELVGAKCPHGHETYPLMSYAEREELVESIKAGKNVPCSACGKALVVEDIVVEHLGNGLFTAARCPQGHESWPLVQAHGDTFRGWYEDDKEKVSIYLGGTTNLTDEQIELIRDLCNFSEKSIFSLKKELCDGQLHLLCTGTKISPEAIGEKLEKSNVPIRITYEKNGSS